MNKSINCGGARGKNEIFRLFFDLSFNRIFSYIELRFQINK